MAGKKTRYGWIWITVHGNQWELEQIREDPDGLIMLDFHTNMELNRKSPPIPLIDFLTHHCKLIRKRISRKLWGEPNKFALQKADPIKTFFDEYCRIEIENR